MKTVISASRRTDIPAFYMDWFMHSIRKGRFEVVNPYSRKIFTVSAVKTDVHSIVFWSKNLGVFLKRDYGRRLEDDGYHLFFNFCINSESALLEPGLPSLKKRLAQLELLCRRHDPRSVQWRFDPICFYRNGGTQIRDNLKNFGIIAQKASALGVTRCITSFMDMYPKIQKRIASGSAVEFVDIPVRRKINILTDMCAILTPLEISLETCCEGELLDQIEDDLPVGKSACIPNDRLMALYGGRISLAKDQGQRRKAGCGCMKSVDIGSYKRQPCYHNCLYCYANPAAAGSQPDYQVYDKGR